MQVLMTTKSVLSLISRAITEASAILVTAPANDRPALLTCIARLHDAGESIGNCYAAIALPFVIRADMSVAQGKPLEAGEVVQ